MGIFKRRTLSRFGWFRGWGRGHDGHGYLLATHPSKKVGRLYRNTRCYCGSGLKYKCCCYGKDGLRRTA